MTFIETIYYTLFANKVICSSKYQRLKTPPENSVSYVNELNIPSLEFSNIGEDYAISWDISSTKEFSATEPKIVMDSTTHQHICWIDVVITQIFPGFLPRVNFCYELFGYIF